MNKWHRGIIHIVVRRRDSFAFIHLHSVARDKSPEEWWNLFWGKFISDKKTKQQQQQRKRKEKEIVAIRKSRRNIKRKRVEVKRSNNETFSDKTKARWIINFNFLQMDFYGGCIELKFRFHESTMSAAGWCAIRRVHLRSTGIPAIWMQEFKSAGILID